MLDRQVLIGEWTARQVSTHWPISGGCEHPLQWSSEVSQQAKLTSGEDQPCRLWHGTQTQARAFSVVAV